MYDVFVLGEPGDEVAEALYDALRERGVYGARGPAPEACRVLVRWGGTGEWPGAAVLDAGPEATWLPPDLAPEERQDRVVDCVLSILELGSPERLTDPAQIRRIVDEVSAFVVEHDGEDPLQLVVDVIERAVDRGAPIHNAGAAAGCAQVYEVAIEALLRRLADLELPPLLAAIAEELANALEQEADPPGARSWDLRNTFDRILLAYHTAQGMQSMDQLFESLQLAGRALSPSLLYDVIGMAIARGAPVFNAGGHEGCARIYLRTAEGVLDLLDADLSEASRSEQIAHETLSTLVDGGEARVVDEATELAWDLRSAFDAIVNVAAEERDWKHDA